jgi:O-antigen/teichoic acid export membrane protein
LRSQAPTSTNKPTGTAGRLVASNTGAQVVTFAARAVAGLAAVVLVARHGGPQQLGIFLFALTLSQMFSFAVGLGLPNLITREVARQPNRSRDWIGMAILVALVAGAAMTVALAFGVRLSGLSSEIVTTVSLAGIALSFDTAARLQFAAFEGWERMWLEAGATCVQEACFVAGTVVALATGHGALGVMLAYVLSRVVGAVAGWVIVSRSLGGLVTPRANLQFLRTTLRQTVPFALDDALSLTYIRVDAVLLGFLKGPVAVGLYQAGTILVLHLNVLARVLNTALYPRMSKAWPDAARLNRYRNLSLSLLGAIAVPAMVGSVLLAPRIFRFLYGPRFDQAVLTYQVLALVIAIRMLGHTMGTALTAANRQTARTVVVAAGAVANLGLNLYFIPRFSYLGAAITTAVTESGVFLAYAILGRGIIGRSRLLQAVALPAVASLPMAAILVTLRQANLLLTIGAGILTYAAALLAVSAFLVPWSVLHRPRAALTALVARVTE